MAGRIRSLVNLTGLTIAAAISLGVPIGYGVEEFYEARDELSQETALSAQLVSQYAFKTGPLWPYSSARLEEVLEHERNDRGGRRSIFNRKGEPVLRQDLNVAWPILSDRAPIEVGNETIGWVEVEKSQRPLVENVGLVALVSGLLGIAALFGFRNIPLRVLDRTLARLESRNRELQEREAELGRQQVISDAALNTMAQALCMFDAQKRLVICNKRYADLYKLPATLTAPGTPLVDIIEHRVRMGDYTGTPEAYRDARLATAGGGKPKTDIVEQADGRAIEIDHQPLPDGGWVATHEDITERRGAEARIAYLATHDALTGLPNRVLFREKLEAARARAVRGDGFAVHCLDLDRFKDVNDTLGHPIGDALLQQVAERLRQALRDEDAVARLGGDEFAILQCQLDRPEMASLLAARIVDVVGKPYHIEGQEIVIAASVGVALAPGDGVDPDRLMKNADLALYRAKADGRGTFRFFEQEMDARMQARRLFETQLRSALANGEFEVFYQPVFDLATQAISGFEALLRWRHPTRGMVSPIEFIPVAEETGLIIPLGEWVLRQACSEAASWPDPVRVAVNLSAVQFKSRNLVGTVMSALATAGLAPQRLELEVTESVLLLESEMTRATLHRLRDLGVRIAMDDFGTGYSSLSYLRSFPFDKIKIDRSFVRELSSRPDCIAIVHAITDLARNLGMATTAEGVETDEQQQLLIAEGCTEIQGYLISPPKPASNVPRLLDKYNGSANVVHLSSASGRRHP